MNFKKFHIPSMGQNIIIHDELSAAEKRTAIARVKELKTLVSDLEHGIPWFTATAKLSIDADGLAALKRIWLRNGEGAGAILKIKQSVEELDAAFQKL